MQTILARLNRDLRVDLSNGRHEWRADEPTARNGDDTGPAPYELLLGSLAACTVITLAMYARHKGIEISAIEAEYEFDRIPADECETCDDMTGTIERIRSRFRIEGPFDDAQKKRLAQIVRRCPVHKTLETGLHIVDEVEFA